MSFDKLVPLYTQEPEEAVAYCVTRSILALAWESPVVFCGGSDSPRPARAKLHGETTAVVYPSYDVYTCQKLLGANVPRLSFEAQPDTLRIQAVGDAVGTAEELAALSMWGNHG